MGIGGAVSGYKGKHLVLVQLYRLAGSEVICADNHLFVGNSAFAVFFGKTAYNAIGNILYISGASLHICVLHGSKHSRKIIRRYGDCIFRIDRLGFDNTID